MLQNIRNNMQGILAKCVIALMIIPFVLFGVESLVGGGGDVNVASVNGEDITATQLQQAIQLQRRQLLNAMGENFDPEMLNENRLRQPALDQLIQRELLLQAAVSSRIDISSQSVDQAILQTPAFQENGVFSDVLYRNVLSSNGYSASNFKSLMKTDMVTRQLDSGISGSDFLLTKELEYLASIVGQKRNYQYLTISLDKISDSIEIEESAIESYYNENTEQFKTDEQVKLSYIELEPSDFFEDVTENQIREAYDIEIADYKAEEERRVSHILIEISDERNESDAESLANSIAEKLSAGEGNFTDLAKEFSDDTGSATAGGDLGFTKGDTFPPEFEEALFALNLNQVSTPVLTDSGYHLIVPTEISAVEKPSFEDRKEVIKQRLQLSAAESQFVATVEELKDLVFNSEDLSAPASELSLEVVQSDWVKRNGNVGVFANPQVISAVFSDDVLQDGNNSEVIELANDRFIVMHVDEYQPSEIKPLADVSKGISSILSKQGSIELAKEQAQSIADSLVDKTIENIASDKGYEWKKHQDITRNSAAVDREILQSVFEMPEPADNSTTDVVTLLNGNVAVIKLDAVNDGRLDDYSEAEKRALIAEIRRNLSSQSMFNYTESLRSQADINIL